MLVSFATLVVVVGYAALALVGTRIKKEDSLLLPLGTALSSALLLLSYLAVSDSVTITSIPQELLKILNFWPAAVLPFLWPLGHYFRAKGMAQEAVSGSAVISNTQIIFTILIESILVGMGFSDEFLIATGIMLFVLLLTFGRGTSLSLNSASFFMFLYVLIAASLNTIDSVLLKDHGVNLFVLLAYCNFISLLLCVFFFRRIIRAKYVLLFAAIQLITLPSQQLLFREEGSSYAALIVSIGYIVAKSIYNYKHKDIPISRTMLIILLMAISTLLALHS